ncbi:MAG: hypothetical protein QMD14_00270 [Candidatus Aenigmarchaeota archaeon]|nr:hypothetical protein [Candidatus Aenigmarchaeota archaeon]
MKKVKFRSENEEIVGSFYLPHDQEKAPIIVCCHGIEYGEEWNLVEKFPGAGLGAFIFPFRSSLMTKRLKDLDFGLSTIEPYANGIGVFAHSLGGVVSVLKAAQDKRIQALVTWATPAYFKRAFDDDFLQDMKQYSIGKAAEEITCPWQIIHGSLDDVVNVEHAEILYDRALAAGKSRYVDLKIIEAGHSDKLDEVYAHAIKFFKRYLR